MRQEMEPTRRRDHPDFLTSWMRSAQRAGAQGRSGKKGGVPSNIRRAARP
jgi:hypothetical protein